MRLVNGKYLQYTEMIFLLACVIVALTKWQLGRGLRAVGSECMDVSSPAPAFVTGNPDGKITKVPTAPTP